MPAPSFTRPRHSLSCAWHWPWARPLHSSVVLTTGEDLVSRVQAAVYAAVTSTVHLSASGTPRITYQMTSDRTGRGWQTGLDGT